MIQSNEIIVKLKRIISLFKTIKLPAEQCVDCQFYQYFVREQSVPGQNVFEKFESSPKLTTQKFGVTTGRIFEQPGIEWIK